MNRTVTSVLLLTTLFISGCRGGATEAITEPTAAIENTPPVASETVILRESTQPIPASNAWKEVRDARFGFGLALPCWWLVTPITPGGTVSVMTVKNYDEAYFNAHNTKGFWDWPNGALKLDVVVFEGADSSKTGADAYMAFVDPSTEGSVSTETQQTGLYTATVVTLANLANASDPISKVFVYRLAPDKLLVVNPAPQSVIDTPDFQAILSSIVFSPDERITLPSITPAPALIAASCAQ